MPADTRWEGHNIIAIGASAGGVEALTALVGALPEDLPAAVFVVLHVHARSTSVLPAILSRAGRLRAIHPEDLAPIRNGCVYVARPDCHLLVERGHVRVVVGPQENRHRPAVDPLFRSAARAYGPHAVGVVLTGSGDDGTAGLMEIKRHGGVAVVQSPGDAFSPGMPRSAIEFVDIDHCLPLREIAPLLVRLSRQSVQSGGAVGNGGLDQEELDRQRLDQEGADREKSPAMHVPENAHAAVDGGEPALKLAAGEIGPGPAAGFACPYCHGHLWETENDGFLRFRCRVGHAFTARSLETSQHEAVEATLWAALNQFEESAALSQRLASRAGERGNSVTARQLNERASETLEHARVLRELLTGAVGNGKHEEEDADTAFSGTAVVG